MDGPPTKRLRGPNQEVIVSLNDPFGDDEDFTQEDLDEIDIIASQAVTSSTVAPPSRGSALDKPVPPGRDATNRSKENMFGFGGRGNASKEAVGEFGAQQIHFLP